MNIVGELIIEKTQLDSLTRSLHQGEALQQARLTAHELTKIARNLDRKLNELQKSVIETRMVPVGQIYSKLSRTVRKVARELRVDLPDRNHARLDDRFLQFVEFPIQIARDLR